MRGRGCAASRKGIGERMTDKEMCKQLKEKVKRQRAEIANLLYVNAKYPSMYDALQLMDQKAITNAFLSAVSGHKFAHEKWQKALWKKVHDLRAVQAECKRLAALLDAHGIDRKKTRADGTASSDHHRDPQGSTHVGATDESEAAMAASPSDESVPATNMTVNVRTPEGEELERAKAKAREQGLDI